MLVGGNYLGGNRCAFTVWGPQLTACSVSLLSPSPRILPCTRDDSGYWQAQSEGTPPGTAYLYRINNTLDRPDPASRFQPEGVHRPSRIIDHGSFVWNDSGWRGMDLPSAVIYELHTGTFTPDGTFDAVIPRLCDLKEVGVTAIELMPVGEFPGSRNWGYDCAYPFAVHHAYGGPDGLKRLVNAAHRENIAVIMDVVYNHFGPEGSYAGDFGPYYTSAYRTPWGNAINFDGPFSEGVRNYYLENARAWFTDYHIDGLRLDAVHSIFDFSAVPFLEQLSRETALLSGALKKKCWLIAESDLNDPRIVRERVRHGCGIDSQWSDDFHHSLHALLTGERRGYYADFGSAADLARAFSSPYVIDGRYSAYRMRRHGAPADEIPPHRCVVFSQNHDQTGNRCLGERSSALLPFEALKLSAAAVILSPYIPLLFMGEEYAEKAPFLYFVDHTDANLIQAVREGRKNEFADFHGGNPPDPAAPETFNASRLRWEARTEGRHAVMRRFYAELIRLRRSVPALGTYGRRAECAAFESQRIVLVIRPHENNEAFLAFNTSPDEASLVLPVPGGTWRKLLDSAGTEWEGPGCRLPDVLSDPSVSMPGHSVALFVKVYE